MPCFGAPILRRRIAADPHVTALFFWHNIFIMIWKPWYMFNKFPIHFNYDGKQYRGEIWPLQTGLQHRIPTTFQVILNNAYCGLIKRRGAEWETDSPKCAIL